MSSEPSVELDLFGVPLKREKRHKEVATPVVRKAGPDAIRVRPCLIIKESKNTCLCLNLDSLSLFDGSRIMQLPQAQAALVKLGKTAPALNRALLGTNP
jgi:hypothetical protein